MEDWQHDDYIFIVHNALERYKADYTLAVRKFQQAQRKYNGLKEMLKGLCRKRGLSEEEIELLFKDY